MFRLSSGKVILYEWDMNEPLHYWGIAEFSFGDFTRIERRPAREAIEMMHGVDRRIPSTRQGWDQL